MRSLRPQKGLLQGLGFSLGLVWVKDRFSIGFEGEYCDLKRVYSRVWGLVRVLLGFRIGFQLVCVRGLRPPGSDWLLFTANSRCEHAFWSSRLNES